MKSITHDENHSHQQPSGRKERTLYKMKPVMGSLILVALLLFSCKSEQEKGIYRVQQGSFQATLNETGNLVAVNARPILMPYIGYRYGWQYKIIGLLEHGREVSKGDSVAQIDPAPVMQYLIKEQSDLEVQQAQMNQMKVQEENKIKNLKSQLESEQLNFDLKKLELEKFRFESERKRQVKALEFEQSRIRLKNIRKKLELSQIVKANNLKIQQIRIEKTLTNIEEAEDALQMLTIRSPISGIFELERNYRTGHLYKIGDEIWQGRDFASVPDLNRMKVKTAINEKDIRKIQLDQKAIVTLDAFPDKAFEAKIIQIGKLSRPKSRYSHVKVFNIELLVLDSDPILKPGMTVRSDIIYSNFEDALYVNSKCIEKEADSYFVYRKLKDGIRRIPVTIGPANDNHTVVYGALQKGDKLVEYQVLKGQL